ncbi:hypothetical protein ACFVG1_36650, partial [Streptomyces bacillaris]
MNESSEAIGRPLRSEPVREYGAPWLPVSSPGPARAAGAATGREGGVGGSGGDETGVGCGSG